MSELGEQLARRRAARDAARAAQAASLTKVKADLAARSIPKRAADRIKDDALDLLDEGLAVASESKGIIAAATATITLWLVRRPLLRWAGRFCKPAAVQENDLKL